MALVQALDPAQRFTSFLALVLSFQKEWAGGLYFGVFTGFQDVLFKMFAFRRKVGCGGQLTHHG